MITLTIEDNEEVEAALESWSWSLGVWFKRAQNGDKVAARKWQALTNLQQQLVQQQRNMVGE